MSNSRFLVIAAIVLLTTSATGCGEPATDTAPPPVTRTDTVAFEPAYPEDVSAEKLSDADKAQQETHKHGDGEEHSHDEKTDTKAAHGHPH